jgi:hypothetical protein
MLKGVAPGLQPDDTGLATTGDQARDMVKDPVKKVTGCDENVAESLPPLKPGRQVGWIFKDGEVVAIERHECEIRSAEDAG